MNTTEVDNENLLKEFEPDANEIMFGQKTLPDRPLTHNEALKRKKIILKLVDQKLKFKLIEMMGKVADKQNKSTERAESHVPTITTMNTVHSQSTSYPNISSTPSWSPYYNSAQYSEGNWQSSYQQQYGTVVEPTWDGWVSYQGHSYQHGIQPYNQNWNTNHSFKQNTNLLCPVVNTGLSDQSTNRISKINENSTKTSTNLANYNQFTHEDNSFEPPAKKQLLATDRLSQSSKVQTKFGINSNLIQINSAKPSNTNVSDKHNTKVGTANINGNKKCFEIYSYEWTELTQLVTSLFRNEVSQLEPLSLHEQKLKYEIIIRMSVNPDSLRKKGTFHHYVSKTQLEQTISTGKMILDRLNRANPQIQHDFLELRERMINDLKTLNAEPVPINEDENMQLIRTKIKEIVDPFLCRDDAFDEEQHDRLISRLIRNPHALEESEMTKDITNKNEVMCSIKGILDEFIAVRPAKPFFLLFSVFIDVPFVVSLHNITGKLGERKVELLQGVLVDWINGASRHAKPRPKVIEFKFSNGSLVMICANRNTFDWISFGISRNFNGNYKGVNLVLTILPVKNPISKTDLKTVLLKFQEPQYLHFNILMEQLKFDNPALLTRRWELQKSPGNKSNDINECIYVGIDIQSLVALEEMNRVAVLGKSFVYFEMSYDDKEPNFLPNHFLIKNKKN